MNLMLRFEMSNKTLVLEFETFINAEHTEHFAFSSA